MKIETGEPIGFGMALRRQICLITTLGIGYLWSLEGGSGYDRTIRWTVAAVDEGNIFANKETTL